MSKTRHCRIEREDNILTQLLDNPKDNTILSFIVDEKTKVERVQKNIIKKEKYYSVTNISENNIDTTYTLYSL